MSFSKTLLVLAAVGCVLAVTAVKAQNIAGSISGIVQDAQGAVVPGAKVTLTNEAQGAASARAVATGPEGAFVFSPVLAGKYTVEAWHSKYGLKTMTVTVEPDKTVEAKFSYSGDEKAE